MCGKFFFLFAKIVFWSQKKILHIDDESQVKSSRELWWHYSIRMSYNKLGRLMRHMKNKLFISLKNQSFHVYMKSMVHHHDSRLCDMFLMNNETRKFVEKGFTDEIRPQEIWNCIITRVVNSSHAPVIRSPF